ncbi:hypothetical protein [Catenulispora acidiphila]|nr:hypothetical protein [Catenulispora acidiphila]
MAIKNPLMGAAEIGKLFDVSRQRVQQLIAKADFPVPEADLAMGKVWSTRNVKDWGLQAGRPFLVAYAFRDRDGQWHGPEHRLETGYVEGVLAISDDANAKAFAGQTITLRCGFLAGQPNPVAGDISANFAIVTGPNDQRYGVLLTHEVADLLAGTYTE